MTEECKHLNSTIRSTDEFCYLFCPDCEEQILITEVFQNLLAEMKKLRDEQAADSDDSYSVNPIEGDDDVQKVR